ncbi:MAG: hypothetical protein Q8O67_07160 [Deltaproteobacteria bacterium]|nr:hypothetical protein [Deltaproteobacteria bacterium]
MRLPFVLSLLLSTSCLIDTSISEADQEQLQLTCDDVDDCPGGFECKELAGQSRCIPSSVLAKKPLLLTEPGIAVDVDLVSPEPGFNTLGVSFGFNEPPAALTVTMDDRALECADDDAVENGFRCSLTVDDDVFEGRRTVRLDANDAAFNVVSDQETVEVDRTGPRIIDFDILEIAPAGDALVDVTSATAGSTVSLRIGFSEDLAATPPVIVLSPGGESCVLGEANEADELVCSFVLTATPGARSLTFAVTDVLANPSGDLVQPVDVEIDLVPPAAPDVDADDGIVYRRAPWGRDGNVTARFDVVAAATAFEAGTTLAVFADVDGAQLLGLGAAADTPIVLERQDRPIVFVAAVDAAGQLSPLRAVKQQEWTATLGAKRGTSTVENPHQVFAVPAFGAPLVGPDDEELADARPLAPGNPAVVGVDVVQSWRERPTVTAPPDRAHACLAFDSARGRAVLFGGDNPNAEAPLGDTWTFGDDGWRREAPVAFPPPRARAGCAYDPLRDRVVLAGGEDGDGPSSQVWEWDGRNWALAEVTLAAPAVDVSAAFDLARAGVVVVAGSASALIDVARTDIVGGPPERAGGGDLVASADGLVFHGGDAGAVADTWLLDDAGWRQLTVTAPPLSPRQLLFTDVDGAVTLLTDADDVDLRFVLRSLDWVAATALDGDDREDAAAATLDDDVLVFGGAPTLGRRADLTVLIAGERTLPAGAPPTSLVDPFTAPDVGEFRQAAFDAGDVDDPAGLLLSTGTELFRLTEAGFEDLGDMPRGVLVDGSTTGAGGGRAILIIDDGAVLAFDLDATSTREFATGIVSGVGFGSVNGAHAARRGDAILLVLGDGTAFELRGTTWVSVAAFPLTLAAGTTTVALGGLGDTAVLFPDDEGDTWTFDGSVWTEHVFAAGDAPADRFNASMVTDLDDGTLFLFGGGPNFSDAWTWDGATWSEIDVVGPGGRFSVALGFDQARHRTVAVGGVLSDDEIWEWSSAASDTPALRFAVSVGAAGLDDSATLENVVVDVGDGVDLLLWTAGSWQPASASIGALPVLLSGDAPTMHVAVPLNDGASVDDFQTTLSFRSVE